MASHAERSRGGTVGCGGTRTPCDGGGGWGGGRGAPLIGYSGERGEKKEGAV